MGFFSGLTGRRGYAMHVKGNRLMDAKKMDEAADAHRKAAELYEQALKSGDETPQYLIAYGILLMRNREFEKARELMIKTQKVKALVQQDKRQLRVNFAICEWKLGHLDNAIDQMKNAARDGLNGTIYGSLGYMLIEKARQTGDFDEAVKFNNEAMEYDDEDAVVLDNMGQLNLAMGNREKAIEYFNKAHEEKPGQVDTLYYLAKLAAEDGDSEKAKAYLNDALSGNFSALCTTTREMAQQLLDSL